jgi:class 3 adenylate cyclase
VEPPDIQYARSGDVSIAYQVVGDGPLDLIFVPFYLSIAVSWEHPLVEQFYGRLASFSRLILFDKRGTGISDRPRTPPTLEAQMDDVRAVLDDVGSAQAALFGVGHGGQMCALFAATYPERTSALVLWNGFARLPGTADDHAAELRRLREQWGRRETIEATVRQINPSVADDEEFLRWFAKVLRVSSSPAAAADYYRTVAEADVTEILPAIRVPTLILYRRTSRQLDDVRGMPGLRQTQGLEEQARRLQDDIPDARLVGVPGEDIAPYIGSELTDEVERFLAEPHGPTVPDRVLATVLFTDLVGSTARAAALGDRRWRELLSSHRNVVRRELGRYRGEEVDTAGDGFLATFDGPARAISCARALVDAAADQGLEIRAGLHTGECELADGKVAGIAVHIGARVAAEAAPSEILVSGTVKDLVAGSEIEFADRGARELKGIPGEWRLFAVR